MKIDSERLADHLGVEVVSIAQTLNCTRLFLRVGSYWRGVTIDQEDLNSSNAAIYLADRVASLADELKASVYGVGGFVPVTLISANTLEVRDRMLDEAAEIYGMTRLPDAVLRDLKSEVKPKPEKVMTRFEAVVQEMEDGDE